MYEFVFDGFSKEQCEAYLKRIGAHFDGRITMDNLNYLIFQHQISVPFEDLAVYENWGTVNLEPDALFHKIVCLFEVLETNVPILIGRLSVFERRRT